MFFFSLNVAITLPTSWDKAKSCMIGDSQRDVDASEKVGIKGFLINPNSDWNNLNLDIA